MSKQEKESQESMPNVASIQEKGLANGLGLEAFIPSVASLKKSETKAEGVKKVEGSKEDGGSEKAEAQQAEVKSAFLPSVENADEVNADEKVAEEKEGKEAPDSVDTLKKRLKDTRNWATQVNSRNKELDRKLQEVLDQQKVLQAKLDGTYIEPVAPQVDPTEMAKLNERIKISRALAEEKYGVESVNQWVFNDDAPYRTVEQADPLVKARVFQSDRPVLEAIQVLREVQFKNKYGSDPDAIVAKIREEVKQEFLNDLSAKERKVRTIEDIHGLNGTSTATVKQKDTRADVDLRNIFTGFPTGYF
jgi:hypothetical protein